MSKPIVAIVGRPNVGKSTLFNVLAGDRISIVKDTPGVTRDRIYAECTWLNHQFTLIDTGGIEPDSRDIILSQMREQAQIAIDTADVILFVTDVRQGMVDADSKVADMLRRSRRSEQKREWHNIQSAATYQRDDINPEAVKYRREAKAEESIICYLLKHPEECDVIEKEVPPELFVTAFNKKVYSAMLDIMKEDWTTEGESVDSILREIQRLEGLKN